ncbi:MAG: hypothetical protein GY801_23905 [bacterium]|nr:hypothetical protein [bacterium]
MSVRDDRRIVVDSILQELTGGKPFVFVIMPFTERWFIYREIKRIIEDETWT